MQTYRLLIFQSPFQTVMKFGCGILSFTTVWQKLIIISKSGQCFVFSCLFSIKCSI